jgi:hypothetical protein
LNGVLELAGALVGMAGIGSCCGVTLAVLAQRSSVEIELWGLRGTAVGFLAGVFIVTSVVAAKA